MLLVFEMIINLLWEPSPFSIYFQHYATKRKLNVSFRVVYLLPLGVRAWLYVLCVSSLNNQNTVLESKKAEGKKTPLGYFYYCVCD